MPNFDICGSPSRRDLQRIFVGFPLPLKSVPGQKCVVRTSFSPFIGQLTESKAGQIRLPALPHAISPLLTVLVQRNKVFTNSKPSSPGRLQRS